MDLRVYYQKIREIEKGLADPAVVISMDTSDGGKAGVRTEVPRLVAAKMIMSGQARAANESEGREFREGQLEALRIAEQLSAANRMQVTVVPASEWRSMKGGNRSSKE
jgi:hypothetical protein